MNIKPILFSLSLLSLFVLPACSTNPATGQQQFAPFMSPGQESQVGAEEHQNVVKEFGLYQNQAVQNYVSEIGRRISANTERPDVAYKFFVIDSPIINAFALPGGYIYISRGLLALANSEAEVAAVLAHETGHITARHSAERYSRGVVTTLGAAVLSAAVGNSGVSQAASLGSELYLKSYSRGQESQADSLGIRYLARGGYNPEAMSWFLASLQADSALEAKIAGKDSGGMDYFSTHPATAERVSATVNEARQYPAQGTTNRDGYLKVVNGMLYGDSAKQGFIQGQDFIHTEMGFGFSVPNGFTLINQPSQVVATSPSGAVIVFDMASSSTTSDPYAFLTQVWFKDTRLSGAEKITIHGMPAATGQFEGQVNGKPMTIRLVAIQWKSGSMARFLMAIPQGSSGQIVEDMKKTTYSFHALSAQEKASIQPQRLALITAKAGDNAAALARQQPFSKYSEERFRVLNGLKPGQDVQAGTTYKIVVDK